MAGDLTEQFKELWQKYKQYVFVTVGYFIGLILLLLIIDNYIMPSIVHDRDTVRTPKVIGKALYDAKRVIENTSLEAKVTKEIYSEKFNAGVIVSQSPAGGTMVKSGRPIFLTLSKGKETVPVPYLIGATLRNSRFQLAQKGLELGNVTYNYSDYYGKDTVMSQSKSAGTYIPFGSSVDIIISKGSENQFKIPNLIGLSYEELNSVITESGFVLGTVSYQSSETYLPNVVVDQNPKADQTTASGTAINVVITK